MNATDSTADTKEITILQNIVIVYESKTPKIKENNVDYSIIESTNSEEQPENREPVTETINCPTTNRISEGVNLFETFETIDDNDPDYILESENEESNMGEMDKEEITNFHHPEQCNKITPRPLKKLTKKEERVKLKNTGVEYVNSKGRTMPSKKVLGNPCLGKKYLNMCNKFTDEEQIDIYERQCCSLHKFIFGGTKQICAVNDSSKSRLLPCYKGELPIAKNKYKNLKSLCDSLIIRKEFHHEYLLLKTSNTVADVLEETDDEDEI
ncbi:unnamed protein product [Psylliodes chrysocephalus]|uniref:Uncharacterized protein n=1 Tax=Psylliodes chrysocephalus TaxID=3402493 RepID=A0A9P0D3A8_9CUCU|nr:unnamed protein product [Psylliodes chrysocephala]